MLFESYLNHTPCLPRKHSLRLEVSVRWLLSQHPYHFCVTGTKRIQEINELLKLWCVFLYRVLTVTFRNSGAPFFLCSCTVWMSPDSCWIHKDYIKLTDILLPKMKEYSENDSMFIPAVESHVCRVPLSILFWKFSPLASCFEHVEYSIPTPTNISQSPSSLTIVLGEKLLYDGELLISKGCLHTWMRLQSSANSIFIDLVM